MHHAAVLPLVAMLALSSTAAVAGPDMSRQVSAGVQRGAARFDAIYKEGGIAAASDAVRACYKSLKRSAAGRLAECAALDIVSASVDQQAVHSLGVPPYAFFSGTGPEGRITAAIRKAGVEKTAFDQAFVPALNAVLADYMGD
ncbi:hypothetical protein ACP4J4_02725 [Aureimonas ureilytica]|uniref:hypothetical protein n=1 Tax=Aureimonas ureilytica TaxID=401562 RepID=UPI003CE9F54D